MMFLFSSSIFKPIDQNQEGAITISSCKVLSQQKLQPFSRLHMFGFFLWCGITANIHEVCNLNSILEIQAPLQMKCNSILLFKDYL